MRKEEVTVRDWEGAESCPGCRCASRPGRTAASGERGEGHPLLPSERGLSSSGERPSPTSGSPLGTAGLPARCERMESIPKPVEPSMAPARCRRSHRHWRGGRGGSGLVMVINNNGDDNNKKRKEKKKKGKKSKRKKKKKSKVQRGIRATIAAGLSEAPRVTSRAAPSSASRPAALRQTDRRRGRGRQSQTLAAEGVGRGGDGPRPHPGPLPGHPTLARSRGAGGCQPEVGRQRSIVRAPQRLNHLMIQKSTGRARGGRRGWEPSGRRGAPLPRQHLGQRRGRSGWWEGGSGRTGVKPEPKRRHRDRCPESLRMPVSGPRTAPESLRLQHLGQRLPHGGGRGGLM